MQSTQRRYLPAAAARKLVQAIEVWVPNESRERLMWSSGCYGEHSALEIASQAMSFRPGEGLPGKAWADRSPCIFNDLFAGDFLRDQLAREIGLTAGAAIPVTIGDECVGVAVMLLSSGNDAQGAFEVWRRNERDELGLSEYYYANLDQFGRVSRYVKFPRRAGLPGQAWADRMPKLTPRLGSARDFMRASGARADGLSVALGVPVMPSWQQLDSVFVLLSSARTPIATCFEIWACEERGDPLRLAAADYGPYVDLAVDSRGAKLGFGDGLVGQAAAQGAPIATSDLAAVDSRRADQFVEYGLEWALALPTFVGERLTAVTLLMR